MRIAGIRVGTVGDVSLQPDRKVLVKFDTDRNIKLTTGTQAAIKLSQPRRRSLHGTRRLSCGIDEDPARGRADTGGPHGARTGSRSAARRSETRYPGPESTGRQRADGLAGPDTAGPGRHAGVAVLEDVVVHELARRQQPGHRAVDRRSADHAGHAVEGRRRVLRRDRQAREPRRRALGRTATRSARRSSRSTTARRRWRTCSAGRTRRWTARSTNSTSSRRSSTTTRTASTPPSSGCRASTRSSPGWAPTAPSSRTTSVRSPSGPATFRAGPWSSRGSSKKPEGAGKSRCRNIAETPSSGQASSVSSWPSSSSRSGLQPERLVQWATALRYQALFSEAGGIADRQ